MNSDTKKQGTNTQVNNYIQPILRKESRSVGQPVKPSSNWEAPDFDEFDLCMEVTAYINHWQ
jgi:coenzyme PQQ precursor peptide PqqA